MGQLFNRQTLQTRGGGQHTEHSGTRMAGCMGTGACSCLLYWLDVHGPAVLCNGSQLKPYTFHDNFQAYLVLSWLLPPHPPPLLLLTISTKAFSLEV